MMPARPVAADRMMLCGRLDTLVLAERNRASLHGRGLRWCLVAGLGDDRGEMRTVKRHTPAMSRGGIGRGGSAVQRAERDGAQPLPVCVRCRAIKAAKAYDAQNLA
jgi:hypothetical protein